MDDTKLNYSFEAATPDSIPDYWARVFNGKVEGNRILLNEGVVFLHKFDWFDVLLVKVKLEKQLELERKFTAESRFSIVISDSIRKIDMLSEKRNAVSGGYVFTNLDGVTRYMPGRLNLLVIHLSAEAIRELSTGSEELERVFASGQKFFFEDTLSAQIQTSFTRLTGMDADRNFIRAHVWLILAELFSRIARREYRHSYSSVSQLQVVLKAEKLLLENLATPRSMESIARECGVSYSYLRRSFSRVYQMSMQRYLHIYRMERAQELLQEGKMNVTEVAYMVGYNHLGHFSAEYKKYSGSLPNEVLAGKRHDI